ncbi:zinc-ribbon domain-containing protein [Priestia sp. SB1]|uniref:zinc-ribbon domain-containing protein n=1 Tax=Priestia sp. SB1 TaxID=3132359 RepID=UPI00317BD92D
MSAPIAYEKTLEYHAITTNKQYLLEEYSEKNEQSPNQILYSSTFNVWWKCPTCESDYDMNSRFRIKLNCNCPYCSGRRVNHTNSLLSVYPELCEEWDYDKNSINPKEITSRNHSKVWWKCKDKHEWEAKVSNRVSLKQKCPFCSGRKATKDDNLLIAHPDICEQWDYIKNKSTPDKHKRTSRKKVWWKCLEGHEQEKEILNKVRSPLCSVCNSLEFKRPDLMNEWDYENNTEIPSGISFSSGKKVHWVCSKNFSHKWLASPHKRNVGRGCPYCNESKGEKEIRNWLDVNNVDYTAQKEYAGLVGVKGYPLSYDFYIPRLNLLIEYQGEFHDGSTSDYTKLNLETQKEHDKRKRNYAKINDLLLLEIWYWEFDKIEEILTEIIN